MLKLSFNQRVGLGFAVIMLLLAIAGSNSLWILYDINKSNTRVHETAVPVVRVTNQVQIQLLKLANLSALGFNALSEDKILPYRKDFDTGAQEFAEIYKNLQTLTNDVQSMQSQVADIKANYDIYTVAVKEMFDAKLAALVAQKNTEQEAETLIGLIDNVGASYMDIVNVIPPREFADEMELAAGNANQADAILSFATKTANELQRSDEIERLDTAVGDLENIFDDSMRWFEKGAIIFQPMDKDGFIEQTNQRMASLRDRLNAQPNLIDHKREQLIQTQTAWDKLGAAKAAVDQSVAGLDHLLESSDTQFKRLQGALGDSLDFGFKSTAIITIILLILATQNFNSMRLAIRKKMIDLAKLNKIGGTLAAARDQDTALEQVLHSMSDKFGIDNGSVYLFNKDHELEAKAFLPPMQIASERKAIKFTKGEGVIGRAAESKQAIFVPDTSKDTSYVSGENEKPKALLCIPLLDKDMLIGVMNFAGEVNKVAFADSDYEFVSSVGVSLVTTIKNIRMVEVIEEHNRNLEKKIEERTAALKQKNDDIANMLSNMHQGLFTIVEGGLIHPEYAAYLETIFETRQIANRNVVDLLFKHCNLSLDAIDAATTSISSIVGEDSMMYEFNSHLLVKELTLTFPDLPDKLIELDWDAIIDADDVVTKLMVTVRDVTELKALQAEADGQKQELMIIGEVLAVDAEKFSEFMDGSTSYVDKCRAIIQEATGKDATTLAELFRNIHTVKGNARTYGLKHITETVHQIENTYDQLRKNDEMEWEPENLLTELDNADNALQKYRYIFKDKLGRAQTASAAGGVDKNRAAGLMSKISALSNKEIPDNVVSIIKETYSLLASMDAKPIDTVIADVIKSVNSLARELERVEPAIEIDDGDLLIRKEAHSMLNSIFMHLLRNSMDHGIEPAAERVAKGKPEQGTIWIKAQEAGDQMLISVSDNGRGLALTRILKSAVEKGLYPADAPRPAAAVISEFIFASGFSTAEAVTEVSGRGVGMDAVKQFLLSEGGNIQVELGEGNETDDFRPFKIVINLPNKYYLSPNLLALAS